MALPKDEVIAGLDDELARYEQLIRGLDARAWSAPTRCAGWTVADVSAHLVGTLTEILAGRLDDLTRPETIDRTVEERRGRSPQELADELVGNRKGGADLLATFDDATWAGPAPSGLQMTLGDGVEGLWYDAFVHGDDVRAAVGLPSERGPGLRASVSHLAVLLDIEGWGPATLALDGMEEFAVGAGGGPRVTGDALGFVLAATGRIDPESIGLDPSVNVYA